MLSDFGANDWYVASMKAVIARAAPQAQIIDISHEIEPGNIHAGAFVLSQCYDDFPKGTTFLCVVDPGVGSQRLPIVLYTGDYNFVTPDNGLATLLKPCMKRAFGIEPGMCGFEAKTSNTFHGRDIFAPAAAALANGATAHDIGRPLPEFVQLGFQFSPVNELPQAGQVIYFDRFGNGISNLGFHGLSPKPNEIEIGTGQRVPFRQAFSDVPTGKPVAYIGSGDLLEIAINRGNARIMLDLENSPEITLH